MGKLIEMHRSYTEWQDEKCRVLKTVPVTEQAFEKAHPLLDRLGLELPLRLFRDARRLLLRPQAEGPLVPCFGLSLDSFDSRLL